ncbi:MAG: thiamine pyrophosphate-dependent enzyme [Candidatus Hydrothermales bacterium]
MAFEWEDLLQEELLDPGILSCQGCGAVIALRHILRALGKNTVVTVPACCWTIIDGPYPYHSLKVPLFHTAFETAAAAACGIRAGMNARGKSDVNVLAYAGDGGTFDIGLQALSGVAERNEDIIYICYDNEAYMNTGIQRSGATPYKAWTATTPFESPNQRPKKNIVEIMRAHKIPYIATANVAFPLDLYKKVRKAKEIKGTRFIHVLCPCPPGWRMDSELTVKVARLAVETKVFPLYEIENGDFLRINYMPKGLPIKDYLTIQGRFRHLREDEIIEIQKIVDYSFDKLLEEHKRSNGTIDNIERGIYK